MVPGARDQLRAVGTPGERMDVCHMAARLRHFLERRQVPEADGVVGTASGQARAVGAEGDAKDLAPVRENGQLLVRRKINELVAVTALSDGTVVAVGMGTTNNSAVLPAAGSRRTKRWRMATSLLRPKPVGCSDSDSLFIVSQLPLKVRHDYARLHLVAQQRVSDRGGETTRSRGSGARSGRVRGPGRP
jgi:hypothetical protein